MNATQRADKLSGTFSIRLPERVLKRLRRTACAKKMSMNAYIGAAVASALQEEDALQTFTDAGAK